ncbi:outer membrane beta-barrel protein [Alkalimonas mucilaginosa]|uniref:Outer membrane beta-barrel protein n=1 Tax=Alkalimonas mucilaginosa TaxID=3057676 RepID=A0ABU7JIF2_9GAMM|nr:outer membrane beta-barrel protein [Alkalimonas sp. MEB004]MEE2025481.1 outer membrane beta-barrel protein [Alkalimonas sp. MEB004]
MRCKQALCATLFLMASGVAAANTADISWNYVSAGYAKASIKTDADRLKPDGWQLQGSFLLNEYLYVRARHDRVTDIWQDVSIKAEQSWLSLGLRRPSLPGVDAFFEAGYASAKTSTGVVFVDDVAFRINDSSNGYQLAAGFRYQATPALELGIALRHVDLSGQDRSNLGELSGRYRLNHQIDLYSDYVFDSDDSIWGLGISVRF